MKRETAAERAAWTAHVEGGAAEKPSKYGNRKTNGYASMREAEIAAKLQALERCGDISQLREQVPFVLVAGQGKIRPVKYIADFTYIDADGFHVLDAKGCKTPVYRLKKKLMLLLLSLEIEEV
jgi:hypothetical protein